MGLRSAGAAPDLPVALIEQATLPGQRVLRSDLAHVAELAGREQVGSPALLIVGAVAAPAATILAIKAPARFRQGSHVEAAGAAVLG